MEVNPLQRSSLKIQDLIQGSLEPGKPSQLLIDDQQPDNGAENIQDLPTVKGETPEANLNYGNYEIKKSTVTVKSPSEAKKKIVHKYVKKVDIKIQQKVQDQTRGLKSNSKSKLSQRARPLSQKSKYIQDHSYSSENQTEHISPSKTQTSNGSANSYGINGVDEVTFHEKPQTSLDKSHATKKNSSVQISRPPTDYYIGKIKYHSKLSRESSIENINIQENNTNVQVTVTDLLNENRQSTEKLFDVMQRLNPKSNQMMYLQQSQPNFVSMQNEFGLIHNTAQNKKLAKKVNQHFQNIYSAQKYYKDAKFGGLGVKPTQKKEFGTYYEKFLDYQSKHNLRNPLTKLKVLNSQSKNTMRFNTHLGGSALGVVMEGPRTSIRIPVGNSSGEQVTIGTSSSVLELIDRHQKTKDLSRELRESMSKDSFYDEATGHLVQLNDSGLKISTRTSELDRETSQSMLSHVRQSSRISLNNHQFHMKRDSQNYNSVISSHKNSLQQKQMKLLRDPMSQKKVNKLINTNEGISKIYENKIQKLQEKLNTLEEEMESNIDIDNSYMVQVMTHDEPVIFQNNQMKIRVQKQMSPTSFGAVNTEYNRTNQSNSKNDQNFFQSGEANNQNYDQNFFQSKNAYQSNHASPKKQAIQLLKNENLNVLKHHKQSLGENYDDTYTNESPSLTQTGSQKIINTRKKTRNGSAMQSRDEDKGMIVINSKNYSSHLHSTRRNSQLDLQRMNNSIDSEANSKVTEKDKKERADGFSAYIAEQHHYIAEQQQIAEINQVKDYNLKLQKEFEENQKKLESYHQNLNTKKVVLDINQGIISQSLSHGDSRGSLHDDPTTDIFKPQLNHQYNVILGGDQSDRVSRGLDTQNHSRIESRASKDDLSTIIGTPMPLNNKHPINRKIKDDNTKKKPIGMSYAQVDVENLESQQSFINILDTSSGGKKEIYTSMNDDLVNTGQSLAHMASNKSILKLQDLIGNVKKPLSNKNSMATQQNEKQNEATDSVSAINDKRTQQTPISKGTGYVLNSSGPSLVRASNKQSIESLKIRQNNVNLNSTPFIKIDVQTRQQKKTIRRENNGNRDMNQMKLSIQGGVQIITSPHTGEVIDSSRQSNKSPSQKNLNPNQRKLESMIGSNSHSVEKHYGQQFIVKGRNTILQQSQGQDNPEHDLHFADATLARSSVDSAHKYTNNSGTTMRPTLSKSGVADGTSNTTFLNTLSQNVFLNPRHFVGDQNFNVKSPNGNLEGIPYKGMRGSVTNKNIKNFKNIMRKQQNQLENHDNQGIPSFGMKQMGLAGIPLSPISKPIAQTQFQTPQVFSPQVIVSQAKPSYQYTQGTQVTQTPIGNSPKKKIFQRVRDQMDPRQQDVKVQAYRINELVQRRNSQSVFQTQHQLETTNKTLAQMQSTKENLDMSSVYTQVRKHASINRRSKTKRSEIPTRLPNIYNMNIEQNLQDMEQQRNKTMLEQQANQNQEWSQNLGNGAVPNQIIKNTPIRQSEFTQMRQSHESQQKQFNNENTNVNPQELVVLNIKKINQMQRNDPGKSSSIGPINQDLVEQPSNYSRNKKQHQISVPNVQMEKKRSGPWKQEAQAITKFSNQQLPGDTVKYFQKGSGAGAQTGNSIDNGVPTLNQQSEQKQVALQLNAIPARSSVENRQFQKEGGLQPWGNIQHSTPKPPPRVQNQKFKIRKIDAADPHAPGAYAGHERGLSRDSTSMHENTMVIGSQIASQKAQFQNDVNLIKRKSSLANSVATGFQDIKSMGSQKATIEIQIQH